MPRAHIIQQYLPEALAYFSQEIIVYIFFSLGSDTRQMTSHVMTSFKDLFTNKLVRRKCYEAVGGISGYAFFYFKTSV